MTKDELLKENRILRNENQTLKFEMLKAKYKEIWRLKAMLENEGIPFDWIDWTNSPSKRGFQICYPDKYETTRVCSVIEHEFSYGHEVDSLEILGLVTQREMDSVGDEVLGYLPAENVFRRIKAHYMTTKEQSK